MERIKRVKRVINVTPEVDAMAQEMRNVEGRTSSGIYEQAIIERYERFKKEMSKSDSRI